MEGTASSDSSATMDFSPERREASPQPAPCVIGLYGIRGCGKSFMMNKLKHELGDSDFHFFEGSEVIDSVTAGGLATFQEFSEEDKACFRQYAMKRIRSICRESGKIGIVAGHHMFWSEGKDDNTALRVCGEEDIRTYTLILYVNTHVEVTARQRRRDTERHRSKMSIENLRRWQETEIKELRDLCSENGVLFAAVYPNLVDKLSSLILNFRNQGEIHNQSIADQHFDRALSSHREELRTVIFFDADKTLTPQDTGELFRQILTQNGAKESPLTTLFEDELDHSYVAFRQVMLLYEESCSDTEFDAICNKVASRTALYPQMTFLLHQVRKHHHICPVIVTCGLHRVWEKFVARNGLSNVVKVVGGARLDDGFVVTPSVKKNLVLRAQGHHSAYTWAFGDSPLDIPMLVAANKSIVIVGDEQTRGKAMDRKLLEAIVSDRLQACQALLAKSPSPPRLAGLYPLPVVEVMDPEFVNSIITGGLELRHATDSAAAKLLMTPTRDSAIHGPSLRASHHKVGAYLARMFVSELIGVEEITIRDVHNNDAAGYRLLEEDKTLIVALMRGGESMAFGVNDVFPSAQFLHAKEPEDLTHEHIEGNATVIIVDSVINSGTTIVKFVEAIRAMHRAIRIVVVADVVQKQAVPGDCPIRVLARSSKLSIVALRLSNNKYTESESTDTGNRLFNTTHLA